MLPFWQDYLVLFKILNQLWLIFYATYWANLIVVNVQILNNSQSHLVTLLIRTKLNYLPKLQKFVFCHFFQRGRYATFLLIKLPKVILKRFVSRRCVTLIWRLKFDCNNTNASSSLFKRKLDANARVKNSVLKNMKIPTASFRASFRSSQIRRPQKCTKIFCHCLQDIDKPFVHKHVYDIQFRSSWYLFCWLVHLKMSFYYITSHE